MKIYYSDNLNSVEKDLNITPDVILDFFRVKNIPDSLISMTSEEILKNDSEFISWMTDKVKLEYEEQLGIIYIDILKYLLKKFISNKLWNQVDQLDTYILQLKYNNAYKYNVDWLSIKTTFINTFLREEFTCRPEKHFTTVAKSWGVK